ncbi:hypothetical protein [Uliginosibacterium sp. 31-12]|uniref:hypothetical protein n=1 Tax=Uliginosibacterium sp. 31-12 TaxID=3062781 RepID=UPI0026E35DED|nr:hypothetical protein [Uliginosibacterium sp. 31-12]MDO6385593.1 hypothetical protein [Uliginosibacterium sp. 31-12]
MNNLDRLMNLASGIASYSREQSVLIRLLRKRGSFSEREFDAWFRGREWRRPVRLQSITGDTLLLGAGINGGSLWAQTLELLQSMVILGMVDAKKNEETGLIVYQLPPRRVCHPAG